MNTELTTKASLTLAIQLLELTPDVKGTDARLLSVARELVCVVRDNLADDAAIKDLYATPGRAIRPDHPALAEFGADAAKPPRQRKTTAKTEPKGEDVPKSRKPALEARKRGRAKREKAKTERLPRRSPEQLAEGVDMIVALVKKGPMRAEAIRKELGMDRKEIPRLLKEGLATGHLVAKGEKRTTEYSVQ